MTRILAAALTGLLLLSACNAVETASLPSDPAQLAASPADVEGVRNGVTALTVGQVLRISLPSNATTGYQWRVFGVEGSMLTAGEPFGQDVVDPHPEGLVGVGGHTHWRILAAREGETILTFTYARAWETNTPSAETATYRVVVR